MPVRKDSLQAPSKVPAFPSSETFEILKHLNFTDSTLIVKTCGSPSRLLITSVKRVFSQSTEQGSLSVYPMAFGILQDPAARRATLVDRLRDGQDDEQGHAVEKLAEWDDFGAHFGPPLDRIGIPACVFCTKNRSDF